MRPVYETLHAIIRGLWPRPSPRHPTQPVRDRGRHRGRRHGPGLQGLRHAARSDRRNQDAAGRIPSQRGAPPQVRPRGAHHCGAEPPAHLRPPRHRRAGRHRLSREGVSRGETLASRLSRPAADGGGLRLRDPDGRRAGSRAPARRDPPRPEAGQRHAHPQRREAARLRPRAIAGGADRHGRDAPAGRHADHRRRRRSSARCNTWRPSSSRAGRSTRARTCSRSGPSSSRWAPATARFRRQPGQHHRLDPEPHASRAVEPAAAAASRARSHRRARAVEGSRRALADGPRHAARAAHPAQRDAGAACSDLVAAADGMARRGAGRAGRSSPPVSSLRTLRSTATATLRRCAR